MASVFKLDMCPLQTPTSARASFNAQVDALLSQHGRVETMWMPTIKNLAYVIYESADVAEDTRCAWLVLLHRACKLVRCTGAKTGI